MMVNIGRLRRMICGIILILLLLVIMIVFVKNCAVQSQMLRWVRWSLAAFFFGFWRMMGNQPKV
jgi:hypothetical protein